MVRKKPSTYNCVIHLGSLDTLWITTTTTKMRRRIDAPTFPTPTPTFLFFFFSSFTFFCLFLVRLYIVAFYDSFVNDGVVSCYVSPWKLNKDEMTDSRCLLHCTVSYYIPCLTFVRINSNDFKPIYWSTYYFVDSMYVHFMSNKIYVFIYLFIYSGFNNNRYIYTRMLTNILNT